MFREKSDKTNSILLFLYFAFVLIAQIVVCSNGSRSYLVIGSGIAISIALIVSPYIIRYFSNLCLIGQQSSEAHNKIGWPLLFVISLLVFLLYYVAYYPGCFSWDSLSQYREATANRFGDWHPAIHTLFVFKFPLTLTGGWIGSIVLFQILCFSIALGYSFRSIYEIAGRNYLIGSMVFILCNPLTGNIAMYPWKDVAFGIGALLLMTFALNTFLSEGVWIKKPLNIIVFVGVFVLTTLFRHNAILFTFPLFIAVAFQVSSKRLLLLMTVTIVGLLFIIKGPIYSVFDVHSPGFRRVEMLGLPMTVIGAAVTTSPEKLDKEVLEFAYKVTPRNVWEKYYSFGSFNSVKFGRGIDWGVIEKYGFAKIIKMTVSCFKRVPFTCIRSMAKLTEGTYSLTGTDPYPIVIEPQIKKDSIVKSFPRPTLFLRKALSGYSAFVKDFLPHVFMFYGVMHFLIITSILATRRLNCFQDWKRILFILPIFSFNYGTSLLLTGNNDSPRFFYYTVLVLPIVLLFCYWKDGVTE